MPLLIYVCVIISSGLYGDPLDLNIHLLSWFHWYIIWVSSRPEIMHCVTLKHLRRSFLITTDWFLITLKHCVTLASTSRIFIGHQDSGHELAHLLLSLITRTPKPSVGCTWNAFVIFWEPVVWSKLLLTEYTFLFDIGRSFSGTVDFHNVLLLIYALFSWVASLQRELNKHLATRSLLFLLLKHPVSYHPAPIQFLLIFKLILHVLNHFSCICVAYGSTSQVSSSFSRNPWFCAFKMIIRHIFSDS